MQPEDLVKLVKQLNRAEDCGFFVKDVVETHPSLAAAYESMCPERMCLDWMSQRAAEGSYTNGVAAGEWATLMSADVNLIADNCVKFNGNGTEYALMAESFRQSALAAINEFALRPPRRSGGGNHQPSASAPAASAAAPASKQTGGKRKRGPGPAAVIAEETGPATPATPAGRVPPTFQEPHSGSNPRLSLKPKPKPVLKPSPHHVPFRVPVKLKALLTAQHIASQSESVAPAQAFLKFPPANNMTVAVVLTAFLSENEANNTGSSSQASTNGGGTNSGAQALLAKIRQAVVENLVTAFDAAFLKVLLYQSERPAVNVALLRAFGEEAVNVSTSLPPSSSKSLTSQDRTNAASSSSAAASSTGDDSVLTSDGTVAWHRLASPIFLLRFLMHFPQMVSIVSTHGCDAQEGAAEVLRSRVVPVVEALLEFMDSNASTLGLEHDGVVRV